MKNPIFEDGQKVARVDTLPAEALVNRREKSAKMEMTELMRKQSAADFIGQLRPGMHLYGFSKGQFSLIDVIDALLAQTGPAEVAISTWTAASADLGRLAQIMTQRQFTNLRFLIDFSFQRRQPSVLQTIRQTYGMDAVRVAKNHAKFILVKAGPWRLTVRTSMNLNFNPRFEDIDLKDDEQIYTFIDSVLTRIWEQFPSNPASQTVRQHSFDFSRFAG